MPAIDHFLDLLRKEKPDCPDGVRWRPHSASATIWPGKSRTQTWAGDPAQLKRLLGARGDPGEPRGLARRGLMTEDAYAVAAVDDNCRASGRHLGTRAGERGRSNTPFRLRFRLTRGARWRDQRLNIPASATEDVAQRFCSDTVDRDHSSSGGMALEKRC